MAMSWKDSSHELNVHDAEYLGKLAWLWGNLLPAQRSRIESSVSKDTLRQEHSRHCIIGYAVGAGLANVAPRGNPFLGMVLGFANSIFYDGPNYDLLLGRKATRDERRILDDIYYAKIGNAEHQYRRANELVRLYITSGGAMARI
ncbi:MAG TPA: hypothetical protein VJ792_05085 [Candidatus Nitrosotalea sp.]|nr:hypothetical protein [Candidatus Nitrosotalea sp.]